MASFLGAIDLDRDKRLEVGRAAPIASDVAKRLAVPRQWFNTEAALAQYERADWRNVQRDLVKFSCCFIEEMRSIGVPFFVVDAWRSPEAQREKVAEGVSRAMPFQAPHVHGAAVDIIHGRYAWSLSEAEWKWVGAKGKAVASKIHLPIEWGGDWSFYDPAHWEVPFSEGSPPDPGGELRVSSRFELARLAGVRS